MKNLYKIGDIVALREDALKVEHTITEVYCRRIWIGESQIDVIVLYELDNDLIVPQGDITYIRGGNNDISTSIGQPI